MALLLGTITLLGAKGIATNCLILQSIDLASLVAVFTHTVLPSLAVATRSKESKPKRVFCRLASHDAVSEVCLLTPSPSPSPCLCKPWLEHRGL